MFWTTLLRQRRWQAWFYPWRGVDWSLLIAVWLITLIGALFIHSAELHIGDKDGFQHLAVAALGTLIALSLARVPEPMFLGVHWFVYGLTCVLLLSVHIIGVEANGAQRWLAIGGFNLQPSEFAKISVILTQAALLHRVPANGLTGILRVFAATALPMLLVLLEDLGTSLVFCVITLGMLYWANARLGWIILMLSPLVAAILFALPLPYELNLWIWLLWTFAMGVVAWRSLPLGWIGGLGSIVLNLSGAGVGQLLWSVLQDYQKNRILMFLDPDKDPLGAGYHLIQSRIAIGAGGVWGRGIFQGTQTQLGFIPEQHTDFIFSAIGEELGFVGGLLVLGLFWFIGFRLLQIANSARNNFGSLLAIGLFSMLMFQVVVNIGMTINMFPVTGIPLPFVSYGRSALLAIYTGLGLVLSVANHRPRSRY
ncbi:rod shape-determining protein RodA [Thermosynechococcaceae cyanobacterium Okahandja]